MQLTGKAEGVLQESLKRRGGGSPAAVGRIPGMVRGRVWEPACKPGSVGDSHSSGTYVTVRLERPTREHARAARCSAGLHAPLFGLAPGGVYPAAAVATSAVRSYRTISPLPPVRMTGSAVSFLWHFPWTCAPQALPGTLPYGARTFLPRRERRARLSGRLPAEKYSAKRGFRSRSIANPCRTGTHHASLSVAATPSAPCPKSSSRPRR